MDLTLKKNLIYRSKICNGPRLRLEQAKNWRSLDLNKLNGDKVIWSVDDEFLARFPVITWRVTPRLVRACNARDSFGREQAGSSNLRGDIASITSFIRETCRMERRAVEVTVGESTRCALHARAFL